MENNKNLDRGMSKKDCLCDATIEKQFFEY